VLRDLYVRGKYRDVILPMTVLPPARRGAGSRPSRRGRLKGLLHAAVDGPISILI
jgi:hypothetical protein